MSTRNKLLERIVLALGGTVTNPNNRNQLLLDWLYAATGMANSWQKIGGEIVCQNTIKCEERVAC